MEELKDMHLTFQNQKKVEFPVVDYPLIFHGVI